VSVRSNGSAAAIRRRTGVVEEVRKLYWMWHMDRRSRAPIQRKLWLWRRGFTVLSGELYGLPRRDLHDFLPDFHATHLIKPINASLAFYRHKVAQRALLLAAGIPQTPTIAALWKGRVVLHPFSDRAEPIDPAGLTAWLLADGDSFIVKPEDGGRGAAIYLLAPEDGALVVRRGSQRTAFRSEDFMGRLTLIERRIEQAAAWSALFPETLNTIRALTLWPRDGDGPFLARAIQRIGAPETIPCDNFAGGGIAAEIDIATGRLGAGRRKRAGGPRVTHHPATGAPVEGVVLPQWDEIVATALRAARSMPMNCYVGWDIFVDAGGHVIVGEASGSTDVDIYQVHRGLLADPRVRGFFEETGVLREVSARQGP
jgi:hypothetical protein